MSWGTAKDAISALGAIAGIAVLCILPAFYWLLLYRNQPTLPLLRHRIGSLYLGIRHWRPLQILYTPVFLVRRFTYILALVVLREQPVLVICSLLFCNVAYTVYLGAASPQDSPAGRMVEYVNETLFQVIAFHLVLIKMRELVKPDSTDFEDSMESEDQLAFDQGVGRSLIATIAILQAFNLGMVLRNTLLGLKWKAHLKKLKAQRDSISKIVDESAIGDTVNDKSVPELPSAGNFLRDDV